MNTFRPSVSASCLLLLLVLVSCSNRETDRIVGPAKALGIVLAEEAARAGGPGKPVLLILPDWSPTSTVGESFKAALKKRGIAISLTLSAQVGNPMRGEAVGLKPDDFLALEQGANAAAIVSLAGAPLLEAQDITRLRPDHPPVLVVATGSLGNAMGVWGARSRLASLVQARIIQLAIVDDEPAAASPASGNLDATHQLFSEHYLILRQAD